MKRARKIPIIRMYIGLILFDFLKILFENMAMIVETTIKAKDVIR